MKNMLTSLICYDTTNVYIQPKATFNKANLHVIWTATATEIGNSINS